MVQHEAPSGYEHYVRSWDTSSGTAIQLPIRNPDGGATFTHEDFFTVVVGPELTPSGQLLAYSADGTMHSIDPRTGLATKLWDSGIHITPADDSLAKFQDGKLLVLEVPTDRGLPIRVKSYDSLTGSPRMVSAIHGVNGQQGVDLVIRDFAVLPTKLSQPMQSP